MAPAVRGLAGATGRVARRESRSRARPLLADAVASPTTASWAYWGGALGGGPKERGVAAARSIATKYKRSCEIGTADETCIEDLLPLRLSRNVIV